MSEHFPFSPVGAALLCEWNDSDEGLGRIHWVNHPDVANSFTATVGFDDHRNVLRFCESPLLDARFAAAGADVARRCLDDHALRITDIDVIVAAPARKTYRSALAALLGVPVERIAVADDERMHTASLAGALACAVDQVRSDTTALLIAAGSGITAGAAVYRKAANAAGSRDSRCTNAFDVKNGANDGRNA
jgi:3-oxoacyl-[acyl-carrier-protein] synthase-3